MSNKIISTSWMWMSDQGVNGLRIDRDNHIMKWYDVIGCGCGMDELATEQTYAQYRQEGAPMHIGTPPDDIVAEIAETLNALG